MSILWDRELEAAAQKLLSTGVASNLAASIRYSLLSGGKRYRPRLMEASASLLELPEPAFKAFAVALEMIHTFTLIHDDLPCMDDDDLRRGQPTNHKVYGEALALLAGDGLLPMAFELCLEALDQVSPANWKRAFQRLLRDSGPAGVIGGQAEELLLNDHSSLAALRQMHALKTGALFHSSILIPADLTGLAETPKKMALLEAFARQFGLAFQTADDLDDAEDERDSVTGEYPRTSVLHFLPKSQARDQALEGLQQSTRAIQSAWPHSHSALTTLSEQLQHTLVRA